jgi:excisionase family DNA binding protein
VNNLGITDKPVLLRLLEVSLMKDPRLVVSIGEAAALLGISRSYAYELVRRGDLRVVSLGRRRVVSKLALLELLGYAPDEDEASGRLRDRAEEGPPIRPCGTHCQRGGA